MELQCHLSQVYSTVHILWMTGCHYILMHLIGNIQSVWASYVDSLHCGQRRMLVIYMPINVHTLQKYANTDRRTRRRNSAGATQTDLWIIMGYEYVCVHIMRFTNCCKCAVWDFVQAVWRLNMFHWPPLNLQNVSLGVFICPHPTGRVTKYSNFLLTSGLRADSAMKIILKVSLKDHCGISRFKWKQGNWWLGWNCMSLQLIYLSINSLENSVCHIFAWLEYKIHSRVWWKCPVIICKLCVCVCLCALVCVCVCFAVACVKVCLKNDCDLN